MGHPVNLFSEPQNNSRIRAISRALHDSVTTSGQREESLYRLGVALDIIAMNSDEFDRQCQFSITKIGNALTSYLSEFRGDLTGIDIQRLNVIIFRFVSEFDLSMDNNLSQELESFLRGVESDSANYKEEWKDQINYTRNRMPISILKSLLNSQDFTTLRDVQSISRQTSDNLAAWDAEMIKSEQRVKVLQSTLIEQKNAFNFVGLSKGFSNLENTVTKELNGLQRSLFILGCLLLIPVVLEFLSINLGWLDTTTADPITLIISAVASLTATLLFLYFFRITLRSADSCRAQLVQIRLRMTLCSFIQNYADYSNEIKSKNSEALSKFENLIFSGIVSTEEKLPSTFDGFEQLGGLFKAVRGEAK